MSCLSLREELVIAIAIELLELFRSKIVTQPSCIFGNKIRSFWVFR